MTWQEAIDTLEARDFAAGKKFSHTTRYRQLCADDHPDREVWRGRVLALAGEPAPEPRPPARQYPPLIAQAGNALGAAVQFARSGFAVADEAEQEWRLAICRECEFFDAEQNRCLKCGCNMIAKVKGQVFHCPIGRW